MMCLVFDIVYLAPGSANLVSVSEENNDVKVLWLGTESKNLFHGNIREEGKILGRNEYNS